MRYFKDAGSSLYNYSLYFRNMHQVQAKDHIKHALTEHLFDLCKIVYSASESLVAIEKGVHKVRSSNQLAQEITEDGKTELENNNSTQTSGNHEENHVDKDSFLGRIFGSSITFSTILTTAFGVAPQNAAIAAGVLFVVPNVIKNAPQIVEGVGGVVLNTAKFAGTAVKAVTSLTVAPVASLLYQGFSGNKLQDGFNRSYHQIPKPDVIDLSGDKLKLDFNDVVKALSKVSAEDLISANKEILSNIRATLRHKNLNLTSAQESSLKQIEKSLMEIENSIDHEVDQFVNGLIINEEVFIKGDSSNLSSSSLDEQDETSEREKSNANINYEEYNTRINLDSDTDYDSEDDERGLIREKRKDKKTPEDKNDVKADVTINKDAKEKIDNIFSEWVYTNDYTRQELQQNGAIQKQ
jgi:hypothetical protein